MCAMPSAATGGQATSDLSSRIARPKSRRDGGGALASIVFILEASSNIKNHVCHAFRGNWGPSNVRSELADCSAEVTARRRGSLGVDRLYLRGIIKHKEPCVPCLPRQLGAKQRRN